MRIITLAIAGALVVWGANLALAAKKDHKSDTTAQKTEESTTSPYAPGQQRFKSASARKHKPAAASAKTDTSK